MRVHEAWGVLDDSTEEEGFGQCLWNVESQKQCKAYPDLGSEQGVKTVIEALEKAKEKSRARNAVGWREVVKVHEIEEGGRKFEKIELANEYQWMNYGEYYTRVLHLYKGMNQIGVKPQGKVVIYAETQKDWMACAFAAWYNGAEVVTIYATLGEEGAQHGINETQADTVIVDAKLLKVMLNILPKCPHVKHIMTMTATDPVMSEKIRSRGIQLFTLDETLESGRTWSCTPYQTKPEDVAVIMYTSGTTGAPKGVVISHGNLAAVVAGAEHHFKGDLLDDDAVYMAYLPLAHIMEMVAEITMFCFGVAVGFGSPHTLTDTGVKLKRPESNGDAPVLQPTIMVFAPAVLDKVYQAVQKKQESLGPVGRLLFRGGLRSGERHFKRGQVGANVMYNSLVFKKVQRLLGSKLKACVTGSAPLSPEIQKFIQTVLNVPVRQAYGLTETCAGSCAQFWADNGVATVGPPTVSSVIRLADWPEGNYMNSDKDKPEIKMRRGEVLIGGPGVSQGYFISPQQPSRELETKNKEDWVTIRGERFFRTGDIGQLKEDGTLQIIDRKKDLWKGPNGEYVALSKVEANLVLCDMVEKPMVYGKTGGTYPVALICPQKPRIEELAKELNVTGEYEELCKNEQIVAKVLEACRAKCVEMKLKDFELPQKIALISELWTPENDMLTAAMKLKRPAIVQKHSEEIGKLYA